MAKLIIYYPHGTSGTEIDETQAEAVKLLSNNVIVTFHVGGERRSYNRDYIVEVHDSPHQIQHSLDHEVIDAMMNEEAAEETHGRHR